MIILLLLLRLLIFISPKIRVTIVVICNLSHFAAEFASASCVGHMYFKCNEMHLSLVFYMYHHNLSNFSVIYLLIHVKSRLASDRIFRVPQILYLKPPLSNTPPPSNKPLLFRERKLISAPSLLSPPSHP